ncbi:FISUMP domain-containing protein [Alistipes senegalensis]|uniref:Fibrobacter succinogenes major paralogous domain-containing protein n=1 Tax=Alistipes senegalensis JC50 TaxID=1033732 RepID=A0ABY5V8E4_9BACT|nr:FISUMP domain-containing protein [Alistipes senegalensis]UEA86475.1 hypothetical protein LK406_12350 [Alistipes senegalensis]UWN65936.1 hypothetical protein NQ519_03595 [Alistipes senegalensis JC50]
MKKIFFYAAMTAFAVSVAGCSKDAEVSDIPAVGGKYTLASVSGSLDAEIGTRTGLGTNSVVNWSNKDRILVVNTSNGDKVQYELVSGQGTSVGKFEPLSGKGIAYTDVSDLRAVYPAVAAEVAANGQISFNLNKNYEQDHRSTYGIGSWNEKDSPYSFTYNDIKVSYNTPAVASESTSEVNFKFKQLGTWCTFAFDLSQSDFKDETMESMTITTTAGSAKIGGTATVDFSDPVAPKLGAGSVEKIDWTFNTSSALGSPFSRSVMLFPAVAAGEEMKIVCTTDLHTITFFAKPTQDLSAGKVLRFPINERFTADGTDFRYEVEDKPGIPTFYYYGPHNSYLVYGETTVNIDVTPFKSDMRFRKTGTPASSAPQPSKAKLLWKENTLTGITVGTISNNKVPVTGISGNGNAVVAITDASDNILWSYHIWVPEIDPTAGLLTYAIPSASNGSGSTYEVMPIALGAMNTVAAGATATVDSYGLYYQWGRKDPLGRPGAITASGDSYVVTSFDGLSGITKWNQTENMLNLATATGITAETTDAEMIKYATANPTKFIYDATGKYANYDWVMKKNDHLWGNGSGYLYPRKAQIYKSIYDPCPEGYRVAPKDLWNRFTVDGGNYGSQDTNDKRNATFNASNRNSLSDQHGYHFYYTAWQTGETDFYPASGYRNRASGALTNVGSGGYSWSSSPTQSSASAGFLYFNAAYVHPQGNYSRAYGFPVRCVRE